MWTIWGTCVTKVKLMYRSHFWCLNQFGLEIYNIHLVQRQPVKFFISLLIADDLWGGGPANGRSLLLYAFVLNRRDPSEEDEDEDQGKTIF